MKKILLPAFLLISIVSTAQTGIWGTTSAGGQYNAGVLFKLDASADNFTKKQDLFRYDGDFPQASLYQASDGKLYGMTSSCCTFDAFSIFFRYDPLTLKYEKLENFNDTIQGANPNGAVIEGTDGKLYGMTSKGGVHNKGVIFRYDRAAMVYQKIYDFDSINGGEPEAGLIQGKDGKLYGLTNTGGNENYGVLFQFDPATSTLVKKFDFGGLINGGNPLGTLIQAKNGKLYGLTSAGGKDDAGVLFEFDPATSSYSKKVELTGQADGNAPYGSLMEASDGNLYGVTSGGGANGYGVLFQFNPLSSAYNVKFDFDDVVSGMAPQSSLIQANDGKLYGTAEYGGTHGDGLIFQYDIATSVFTKKFEFNDLEKITGKYAIGAMIQASNGMLYGMGYNGGIDNSGVVYKFDPSTSTFNKEFDFHKASEGSHPVASMVQAKDKMLYGVTQFGGIKNNGTIFQYDPAFDKYTKKYDFDLTTTGDAPIGSLLLAADGKLYGTTAYGGANDKGVLFQFDPASSAFVKKIEFNGANGSSPTGELIQLTDGKIYGMTREGGANEAGILFQYDPSNAIFTKKIDFDDKTKGSYPEGGLTLANNGKLYGVTTSGGINKSENLPNGFGVLFQYDPVTNDYKKEIDFDSINGSNPNGTLVKTADGKLYGMTTNGGNHVKTDPKGYGVLFQYDPSANTITKKVDFDGAVNGSNPNGSLLLASNGNLYGVTNAGGANNMGVIFQFDPSAASYTKKMEFTQASGKFPDHAKLTEVTLVNSIADNQLSSNMHLFPNPANELVTLSLDQKITDGTVKLYTVTGQVVLEKSKLAGDRFTLNIESLAKGAYFIELFENGNASRMKLIKE